MRKSFHRLLSAAPPASFAIIGVLASADPAGAKARIIGFTELMSDARFMWLCIGLILAYTALWWWTSSEPVSRRDAIKKAGLRPIFVEHSAFMREFSEIKKDDELQPFLDRYNESQTKVHDWIQDYMGMAAAHKYFGGQPQLVFMDWPGDPKIKLLREQAISTMNLRNSNLNDLMNHDSWDGPSIGNLEKLKRKLKGQKPSYAKQ